MIKGEFIIKVIPVPNNSGGSIEANRLLTIVDGAVAKCAADSEYFIGVSLFNSIYGENGETPDGKMIDVAISGVVKIVAATDINYGEPVYAASDGRITNSGNLLVGVALESGHQNDLISVLLK